MNALLHLIMIAQHFLPYTSTCLFVPKMTASFKVLFIRSTAFALFQMVLLSEPL